MKYEFIPSQMVCSTKYTFEIENNIIQKVTIENGCQGNTIGLSRLLEGMDVDNAINKLKGIDCRGRGTSCPDQIARALEKYKLENA